ncbi:MAG: CAP domain-containing protein [Hyphomicrobiaceae bacterium]|nr:CAP domain-containing protein [Hyphomicrobiaceae bacterium]
MTPDLPKVEMYIFDKTNIFRKTNKLGLVTRNELLDLAARQFAEYLAKTGKFSHTADGKKPAERISATGYRYCFISENLSFRGRVRGFTTQELAVIAVEGWKKSPAHRRNMMQPNMTEVGVGVAKVPGKQNYMSVQLFGRPDYLRYKFKIRNTSDKKVSYNFGGRTRYVPSRAILTITTCKPGKLKFVGIKNETEITEIYMPKEGFEYTLSISKGELVVSQRVARF